MRVAILLAAGSSRRMGRSKLLLTLGGETVLERSIRNLLEASVDRVRVVVSPGFEPDGIAGAVELVPNPDHDEGLASSMRVGARALPARARVVLIALADKPFVRAATIRTLIERFEDAWPPVLYPVYRGEQGHPVLWAADQLAEFDALRGDHGAKALITRYGSRALEVAVDDEGVCLDIDTPEDYASVRERFSTS